MLEEEGKRIRMVLKSREKEGVSLAQQLVRPDLRSGEPCGRPGCVLDRTSGGAGGPHNVTSAVYQGTGNLCGLIEEEAEYIGETGSSAYHRCLKHEEEVKNRTQAMLLQE